MSTDIRLSTAFLDHPKTVKLERRLGAQGIKNLIALWLWCRVNKPCGTFSGMDVEDIEIAARWAGEPGAFVKECLTLRWMDVNESLSEKNSVEYSLHDWADHNPWAVGSEDRSNASRFNRMAKTHRELYEKLKAEGRNSITVEEFQSLTKINEPLTVVKQSLSPAPSPSPLPSPSPSPIDRGEGEVPHSRKRKVFIKPTVADVANYCAERRNNIDPQYFVDKYEGNGWMVGDNKMKDWKAVIRTWEQNGFETGREKQPSRQRPESQKARDAREIVNFLNGQDDGQAGAKAIEA